LADDLAQEVFERVGKVEGHQHIQAWLEIQRKFSSELNEAQKPKEFCGDPANEAKCQEISVAVVAAAEQLAARQKARRALYESSRFFKLADLVANQPQLYGSFSYRLRDDLVGPDAWSLSATYEQGYVNINGLRRSVCGKPSKRDKDCKPSLDDLEDYIDDHQGASRRSHRLLGKIEYSSVDSYQDPVTDTDVELALDSASEWSISGAYGLVLQRTRDDKEASRFDVELKYEDVDGDPMRQGHRLLGAATLTQKLTDQTSLSLGAVYASDPEYRGDVSHEWSARAGVRWKLKTAADDKGGE
jgi:hypothetical protein